MNITNLFSNLGFPVLNRCGLPYVPTVGAITHTPAGDEIVTYSLHPRVFRNLPERGVFLLDIKHLPTPTPADDALVYLSTTGNALGTWENRQPLAFANGQIVTSIHLSLGGHYLVVYDKCVPAFQLITVGNPTVTPPADAAVLAAPATVSPAAATASTTTQK